MSKIINIRGANGSGKSSIMVAILAHAVEEPRTEFMYDTLKKKTGKVTSKPCVVTKCVTPWSDTPIHVVGIYKTACGGWDKEGDMNAIEYCMRELARRIPDEHIIFEGFVIAKSYARWRKYAEDHSDRFVWAFMDHDLPTLVDRIHRRNGGKTFNVSHLESTLKSNRTNQRKVLENPVGAVHVFNDHTETAQSIAERLLA